MLDSADPVELSRRFAGPITAVELPGLSGVAGLCAETRFDPGAYDDQLYQTLQVTFPRSLARAVPRRRAEFLAGRYLAGTLLRRLGSVQTTVGMGQQRQPLWPEGFTGSITHDAGRAICTVAPAPAILGIDYEPVLPRGQCAEVLAAITAGGEAGQLTRVFGDPALGTTVLFSAKESLFKALYPLARDYFEFTDVGLATAYPSKGLLQLEALRDLSAIVHRGQVFRLGFRRHGGGILTWLVDGAESRPAG
ncbi:MULTISPECIES: 4'-phosphopantetheinyl transferase [Microbulbifer]|uniref:4'-phosphopantetheinyl transferase family protein n=1 Tax=Microbulbifer TaxID=48073 RepID=UPI001E5EB121|nr:MULTISPECIES: 4'-phosphopantetheinyl transferase superfamily protein [Microbulbifer]UHQ56470.1 4'-phosphopantetheinyl transferase superfamily protein [Microbulbifer sp. YPW16]